VETNKIERQDPVEKIILLLRGRRVVLDSDLAELYGVTTKRLNEQVRRNAARFPLDFMFRQTETERAEVVANFDHLKKLKYSKYLPSAFSEHGAIMAANVVNTVQAIEMSIFVVRAFVRLREIASAELSTASRLDEIERRVDQTEDAVVSIMDTVRKLSAPAIGTPRKIGFSTGSAWPSGSRSRT
jgi:hypothetical protein